MHQIKFSNLLTITLLLISSAVVYAQKPSPTANPQQPLHVHSESPLGCESNCLWYSGDFDSSNGNANALYSGISTGSASAQVWVPFLPSFNSNPYYNSVQITSITFNELTSGAPGVTAMTYAISVSTASGFAGHTLYSGNCNYSQPLTTGRNGFGYTEYAFTCNLPSPVTLPTGTVYMVNVEPTITNGSPIYLSDAIDSPEINNTGWSNVWDGSYLSSNTFGAFYVNATSESYGMDEFSVGMTGNYVHAYPVH